MNRLHAYLLALALCWVTIGTTFAASPWETLEHCTLVPSRYNDGDSFHVRHGDREYIFRLYFVDAPEEDASFPQRIHDQGAHFGIENAHVQDVGRLARAFMLQSLDKPFTVVTRWQHALGRSKMPRFYAFVRPDGTDLAEQLVSRGLARVYGVRAITPEGEPAASYRARLLAMEDAARTGKIGAWSLSRPMPGTAAWTGSMSPETAMRQ